MAGAPQQRWPPLIPLPGRGTEVGAEDDRLAGLGVLVGALAQEVLQEGSPVVFLPGAAAQFLLQTGLAGDTAATSSSSPSQVELLHGRRKLLPHPELEGGL